MGIWKSEFGIWKNLEFGKIWNLEKFGIWNLILGNRVR
jgi:hypothetical protein